MPLIQESMASWLGGRFPPSLIHEVIIIKQDPNWVYNTGGPWCDMRWDEPGARFAICTTRLPPLLLNLCRLSKLASNTIYFFMPHGTGVCVFSASLTLWSPHLSQRTT